MAQAPTNDAFDSSGDDREIQLLESDLIELLMRLISSFGESERLRKERDQLQHQLYQTGNDRIQLAPDFEDRPSTVKRTSQDDQTNMSTSRTAPDDRQRFTARKQTEIPGSGGLELLMETDLLANKSHTTNSTDSGMGSQSAICSSVSRPRKSEQQSSAMPDGFVLASKRNSFGPPPFETSENIDVGAGIPHGQFKQLKNSNDAETKIECDCAVSSSLLFPEGKDVFGNQMQYIPPTLQRATSSRQDDQTTNKRKYQIKKMGSHESYFPIQSAKPVCVQRKSSYPAVSSGNSTKAVGMADRLMISCLPQVASKTIFNSVSQELRRVRKEYHRLEQREEEMKAEIYQLRGEVTDMKTKLEEMEKISEDVRKNRVDRDHMIELNNAYMELNSQFEKEKKVHASVQKILKDERARFARDEEHLKKEIEKLKKQLRSQN